MKQFTLFILFVFFISCKKSDSEKPAITNNTAKNEQTNSGIDHNIDPGSFIPSGLPKYLAFGTEGDISQKDKFIPEADYQYQYLAGDIFSNGWTTWNYPSGEFARTFLSQVGEMGKMPVFTYYNIVPAKGRFEDPGFTNLNDAEVMNKYFEDWKFLLQICNEYGKPVIIHYEPDLFGYMQMFKNDKAKSTIMVSKSSYPDALPFSNDAKGLAQTIVKMRDKYAPNVLLGWHASTWATGSDLIKSKRNPEQLAVETVEYYKSLKASFDLFFSEFSDRDAGYDQIVNGKQNIFWSTQGGDDLQNMSDFDRFQRYLKTLNQQTQLKIILWQIPIGNSSTASCNNTRGHYRDNKAEYFFQPVIEKQNPDKIAEYANAGVIAFLFGRGAGDCTSYMDSRGDGITGTAEAADDDGGYLRKAVKAYYKNGPVKLR